MFYVYILRSKKDKKCYTGSTGDLRKRFREHNDNKIFSTKNRTPLELIYYEACLDEKDARVREKYLKSGMGKRYLKNRIKRFLSLTGFTMIEMLIVVGIISVLSSVLISNMHVGERQIILFREQSKIMSVVYRAKSLSVSLFGKEGVPCGYGVHFEAPRTFLIFNDSAFNCAASDNKFSGDSEIYESFSLDSRVGFDSLMPTDILFLPPNPRVVITPAQDEITINLKIVGENNAVSVKINSAGQISTD